MKYIFAILALVIALSVNAAEIKVAFISSDAITETTVFYVETNNDGSAQAMRYVKTLESGQISEDVHATVEEVLNGGVVVQEMEGREVIRLFLGKFDIEKGGDVRMVFLANGVTGSQGTHMLKLVRKDGSWALADVKGNIINTMFIRGNYSRILRRYIGVASIETSFQVKNK